MSLRSITSLELYYQQYLKMVDYSVIPSMSADGPAFRALNVKRIYNLALDFNDVYYEMTKSDKNEYLYFKNMTYF